MSDQTQDTGATADAFLARFRKAFILQFFAAVVLVVTVFDTSLGIAPLLTLAALLLSIAALAVIPPRSRLADFHDACVQQLAGSMRRGTRIAAAAICIVSGMMFLGSLGKVRATSKSAVSASNLRGISAALRDYASEYAAYPPALSVLENLGLTTSKQLCCPADWSASEERFFAEGYVSYAYQRGGDPGLKDAEVILARERLPWSVGRATWCCPRGYFVLFADGKVRWLDTHEMKMAQQRDTERRRELGWPTP